MLDNKHEHKVKSQLIKMSIEATEFVAIENAYKQFAPEDCPITEGLENDDVLTAVVNVQEGFVDSVTIECEGTDYPACKNCTLNNRAQTKHFTIG